MVKVYEGYVRRLDSVRTGLKCPNTGFENKFFFK